MATYNDNQNPFAFQVENGARNGMKMEGNRMESAENAFAYPAQEISVAPGTMNQADSMEMNAWRLAKYRRWNIVLKLMTAALCLAAAIVVINSKQTSSNVPTIDGSGTGTAKYKSSGTLEFFAYSNIAVFVHALVFAIIGLVMLRRGVVGGQTAPSFLMWIKFISNIINTAVLLLAFSTTLAVEVLFRHGLTLGGVKWLPICKYFDTFCRLNEIALAISGLGFVCFALSTVIDGYFIFLRMGLRRG